MDYFWWAALGSCAIDFVALCVVARIEPKLAVLFLVAMLSKAVGLLLTLDERP